MRKLICLLVALLLCVTVFVACKDDTPAPSEDTTVTTAKETPTEAPTEEVTTEEVTEEQVTNDRWTKPY